MSVQQTPVEIKTHTAVFKGGTPIVGPDGVTRSISENKSDGTYTVHGVAIGEDDVTRGSSGIKKFWPGEELREAAESLEGQPLVENHDNTTRGVVGRVIKAGYKDGVGVLYEANLHDEELASKIENDLLEVSIRGYHSSVEEMEERDDGSKVVENIEFDNLSVVPTGAAPSNSLEMGEHSELSTAQLSEMISDMDEELQEWQPGDYVQWGDSQGMILEMNEGAAIVDNYQETDDGKWQSTMEEEEVSTDNLEEWDVDEENITSADDSDDEEPEDDESEDEEDSEEAEADVSKGDYVTWHSGEGIVTEVDGDQATVQPYAKNDQVWEPTDKENEVSVDDLDPWDVDQDNVSDKGDDEELAASTHKPSWSGTRESDSWNSLSLSDFTEDSWEDLSSDEQSDIADHFIASASGFPPDSFGDLKLPVVHPSGELDLAGLRAAKSRAGQTDGVEASEVKSTVTNLASDNFDVDWDDSEENAPSGASIEILRGDDLLYGESTSDLGRYVPIRNKTEEYTMFNEEELEDLDNPVAVEKSDIEELRQKASDYEELQEEQQTVEEMSETLEELRDRTEILDEVDRDLVDELEGSDDPIVIESDRFDELEQEAETVKQLYAERVSEESEMFDSDELMDRYSIDELREKFDDMGGDLEEELDPAPKSQDPSEEELEENNEDDADDEQDEEELSDEVESKQAELREKMLS